MNNYVYVGNLPYDITEQLLQEQFDKIGKVEEIRIARSQAESTKGLFMGYAFVKLQSETEVKLAITNLQNSEINERKIYLEPGINQKDLWEKAFGPLLD